MLKLGSATALSTNERRIRQLRKKRNAFWWLIRPKVSAPTTKRLMERVFEKRYEQWLEAARAMEVRIDMYEVYSWLVGELREGLEFVDAESGLLRSEKEMEAKIGVIALLMRELHHLSVQAVAERLERQKGELVKYLTPLQEKLAELEAEVGDKEVVRLCLKEWQLEKETAQGKKAESLETCRKRFRGWKEEVVEQVRKTIRWLLGKVVRASSLVETVNSWLRPFLCFVRWTHQCPCE